MEFRPLAFTEVNVLADTVKFVFLVIALLVALPLAGWLRRNRQHTTKIWIAMGLLPFVLTTGPHALYIAIISWPGWPGYVKGAEFSVIDVLALAIYLSQPRVRQSLPFLLPMSLYFIAVVVSTLPAEVPMASMFYAWQLARIFLVYLSRHERAPTTVSRRLCSLAWRSAYVCKLS